MSQNFPCFDGPLPESLERLLFLFGNSALTGKRRGRSRIVGVIAFYEKVIKVKADVAAFLS